MAPAAQKQSSAWEQEQDGLCFLCMSPGVDGGGGGGDLLSCPRCPAQACSQDHMDLHSREEDGYCYPFRIRERDGVGRYVVATRDLSPLDVVMEDSPAVYGPEHDTVPVCLECLNRVDGSYLCPSCGLPLCGEACFLSRRNHRPECEVFSSSSSGYRLSVNFGREKTGAEADVADVAYAPEYCCIAPLRLLWLREADPKTWARVEMLMDHDQERRSEEKYWSMFRKNVVDFLRVKVGLGERFSEEEVFRVIGILRTNAFFVEDERLKSQDVGGRAVYPTFSFLSHSCICNARYSVLPGQRVQVRAQVAIPRGAEITIQYISFMYGQLRRRSDIRDCWFFQCACARCTDPTEMGSNLSAHRCGAKEGCDGSVLPRDGSRDLDEDWACTQCGAARSVASLKEEISQCQRILHSVDRGSDVIKYEKILELFLRKLKPTHYLVMTVKKFLGDLYGLTTGFTYRELSRERFERKIEYMRDFLDVVSKVDPGLTKWRGTALHTLLRPMMYRANGTFRAGEIDKGEFVRQVEHICELLRECLRCLECEPEGTKEADVAALARDDLAKLGDLILFAEFL